VLKSIYGLKMEGGTGGWKKPHNVSFYNLYSPSNIIIIIIIMHSVDPYKVNQPIGYRVCPNVSVI